MAIRSISQQEYRLGLMKEITEKKLLGAIEERCDKIEEEARDFDQAKWGYITEQLNEILDLAKIADEFFLGLRLKVKMPVSYKSEPIIAEQYMDVQTMSDIIAQAIKEKLKEGNGCR